MEQLLQISAVQETNEENGEGHRIWQSTPYSNLICLAIDSLPEGILKKLTLC